MEKKVNNSQTKFIRYIKSPIRLLSKLRDIYIHNMIKCAGPAIYGGSAMSCPAPYSLPKSLSVKSIRSSNDDYSELIRAASIRTLGRKIDVGIIPRQQQSYAVVPMVVRSQSVAIQKIDEDEACDFADDHLWLLRSKSYAVAAAVSKRRNFY